MFQGFSIYSQRKQNGMIKKETLKTVAEKTGFSVSTVSRVLGGRAQEHRIAKKTIEAITREAERLNYSPNALARALRTRKTNTVGLVIPSLDNLFFATLANTITNIMRQKGITILLGTSMENDKTDREIVSAFADRNVDGVIMIPSGDDPSYLEEMDAAGVPIVLMDRYFEDTSLQYVSTDNYEGGKLAARYLLSKGYRTILAIQGLNVSMPNIERVRGFSEELARHKEEGVQFSVSGDSFSVENGYEITKIVFNSNLPKPDAIFALGMTISLGVLSASKELGLRIPEDVAILSFDDNVIMDYLDPPLTRIHQPIREICQIACDIMVNHIVGNRPTITQKILVKPSIVEGRSC